jgi:two-component system chemotaxis sensor kinase CheA
LIKNKEVKHGIKSVNNKDVIDHRGKIIPLVYLDKVFELKGAEEKDSINVVVCTKEDSLVA